ncbi:MAG: hypothetical protein JXQ87_16965 [Bacteroidia bacterium]
MTLKFKFQITLFFALAAMVFSSCQRNDDGNSRRLEVPSNLSITDSSFFPEDIVVAHNTVYVSGLGDGTIRSFDLTEETPTANTFAAAKTGYSQRWGLTANKKVLLSIANNADFGGGAPGASKLIEYDREDGTETNSWDLPSSTIGHTVSIVEGKYYVSDFANPRIIEVDPESGNVNESWFTSSKWDPSIDGNLGGVIYDKKGGFYAYLGFKLWYLPIDKGEPGELQEVSISGLSAEQINVDGITWVKRNNTLYYASNDTGNPENVGTVYKLEFSDETTAEGSIVKTGLDDTSGLWHLKSREGEYLLVCESQFGALFGINGFEGPFNIEVISL